MDRKLRGIDEQSGRIRIRVYGRGRKKPFFESFAGSLGNPLDVRKAIHIRDDLKATIRLGLDPDDGEIRLFGNVAQEYFDDTHDLAESTRKKYKYAMNTTWKPLFLIPIGQIRPIDLRKLLKAMTKAGAKTKANAMCPVRSIFKYALSEGYIDTNPCEAISFKKYQKPPIDYFRPDEALRLLEAMDECAEKRYFIVFLGTGMRPSELLALDKHDVQGDYCRVSKALVYGTIQPHTKTHDVRDVYLEPQVQLAIKQQAISVAGEKLFPWWSDKPPNVFFRRALSKARLRKRTPYKCRHSRASELLTKGVNPAFAAKQLGHTLETFFKCYGEWINGDANAAEIAKLQQKQYENSMDEKSEGGKSL